MDSLGVQGVHRLLAKVTCLRDDWTKDPIEGIYKEARIILGIRKKLPDAWISVSEENVGSIKDLDVRILIDGVEYLVEIKSGFGFAAIEIEQIRSLSTEASTRSKNENPVIPVCIIVGADQELEEIQFNPEVRFRETRMNKLLALYLITRENPQFEFQNINGRLLNSRIREILALNNLLEEAA